MFRLGIFRSALTVSTRRLMIALDYYLVPCGLARGPTSDPRIALGSILPSCAGSKNIATSIWLVSVLS